MTVPDGVRELERLIADHDVESALYELRSGSTYGPETSQALLDLAVDRAPSGPELALHALDLCERVASEVGPAEVLPAAAYLRARLALVDGYPGRALELIATAKAGWLDVGRPIDAYRTELGRMNVLDDLGRHGEAIAAAENLLDELARLDDDEPHLAWVKAGALENLGVACGFTGQHHRALDAYARAQVVYEQVGGVEDVARSQANRGVELVAVGRASEGREVLRAAASRFAESDDQLSYAKCLGHWADAELLLGRYTAALGHYEEARRLLDGLLARTEAQRLRLRTARAYLALNLIDEAESIACDVVATVAELGLSHDLAEAEWLVAVARIKAGRPAEALEALDRAIAGSAETGDPSLLVNAMLSMSEALSMLGDVAAAADAASRALRTAVEGERPAEELHARLRLAQVIDDDVARAEHLGRAIELADELALPHVRYPVLLEQGRLDRGLGRVDDAWRRLSEAVEVVEGLRGLIPDEAVRTSYFEGRTAAHGELTLLLLDGDGDGGGRAKAFDLAEASRARTLSDLLAGVVQPASESLHEADLDAAYSALSGGGLEMTDGRRSAVRERALVLERSIRIADLQAEAHAPTAATSRSLPESPRPTADDHVVEYQVIGDQIIAFVWRDGLLRVVDSIASAGAVVGLLQRWELQRRRAQLGKQIDLRHSSVLVASAERALRDLWLAVFQAVEVHLDPDAAELLIVPHGPLHQVPFHALIGDRGRVGERWTVSVAPSFAVADSLRSSWTPRYGRSLVLGVPDEKAPAVAGEALFVSEMLDGAECLIGPEATGDALISRSPGADVVHLACHGIHRARNPMFSALRLGDRWFTARDVLSLELDSCLVTLSACESGRHSGRGTVDEAIGLARSFVAAGASSVVVSLWTTDDQVTSLLMHHFYRGLADGRRPADSLRAAQLAASIQHPNPADWAPFVIHGGM